MAQDSALVNIVAFFDRLGVYDVILPFLLVFTLVFSILEKTKVLGTENDGNTKKNLNAMVAFVLGFFVIASAQLVEIITQVSSQVVVLLLLAVLFLMLIGSFAKEGEAFSLENTAWNVVFMVIMFVGIIFIFLNAIKTKSGHSWLEVFWNWLSSYWTSAGVAALIFIILVILFMAWITGSFDGIGSKKKSDD